MMASGTPGVSAGAVPWVKDSGGSHQMTGDVRLLSDVGDCAPVGARLAHGRVRRATHSGTAVLSEHGKRRRGS